MDRLEHQAYWASLVRLYKDRERKYDTRHYDSEQIAQSILDYVRYTRIRQWTLFFQRRGEEYEKMIETLVEKDLPKDAILRFTENDALWEKTLELATM